MYKTASWPLEAAWKMTPMIVRIDTMKRPGFLPHLSEMGEAIRAPAKAPACITDTILAERFVLARESFRPNTLLYAVSRVAG